MLRIYQPMFEICQPPTVRPWKTLFATPRQFAGPEWPQRDFHSVWWNTFVVTHASLLRIATPRSCHDLIIMGHFEALSRCAVASGLPLCLFFRHDFFDLIVIQIIMRPPPWPSAFHLQLALFLIRRRTPPGLCERRVWYGP